MNLPERFPPDDPREWMNRARSDLTDEVKFPLNSKMSQVGI